MVGPTLPSRGFRTAWPARPPVRQATPRRGYGVPARAVPRSSCRAALPLAPRCERIQGCLTRREWTSTELRRGRCSRYRVEAHAIRERLRAPSLGVAFNRRVRPGIARCWRRRRYRGRLRRLDGSSRRTSTAHLDHRPCRRETLTGTASSAGRAGRIRTRWPIRRTACSNVSQSSRSPTRCSGASRIKQKTRRGAAQASGSRRPPRPGWLSCSLRRAHAADAAPQGDDGVLVGHAGPSATEDLPCDAALDTAAGRLARVDGARSRSMEN
jgi:hypothetical protein